MHLKDIACLIEQQRDVANWEPTNLTFIAEILKPTPSRRRLHDHVLLCPHSMTALGEVSNVDEWIDYIYRAI